MNLTPEELALMARVRVVIEEGNDWYLCRVIADEVSRSKNAELGIFRNRVLFWRRNAIRERWLECKWRLLGGIQRGISFRHTLGMWFESQTRGVSLNLPDGVRHNRGIYQQVRLAWIDRMLNTGEMH